MNYKYPKQTWVEIPDNSHFTLHNLPYGIIRYQNKSPRMAVAIGNHALDLAQLHRRGYLDDLFLNPKVFKRKSLNTFISLGKPYWIKLRTRLLELLDAQNPELRDQPKDIAKCLLPLNEVIHLLPIQIGDYTDFYSSLEHATNVGKMFRPDGDPLLPNWKHMPIGYHGRAGSIIVSGTPIHRPKGQTKADNEELPSYGPTQLLDFELEVGYVIGKASQMGEQVSPNEALDHIFGLVLVNDWSARDIQKWEYVPLGPFLGKNFATTISPWVVTMDALEPFLCEAPPQHPSPLPYLIEENRKTLDIQLEVTLTPQNGEPNTLCKSNFKFLYWTPAQQIAHHSVNGCNLRIADLYATGTISGSEKNSFGSMLELTWRGTQPIALNNGESRKFIADFDTITLHGFCQKENIRIGFGCAEGKILPSL
jgi:fumarylacetoacetase